MRAVQTHDATTERTTLDDAAAAAVVLDCDSEELEALEDAAELEELDDDDDDDDGQKKADDVDRLYEEAAVAFPAARMAELISELKQVGLIQFMQSHVEGLSVARTRLFLLALGVRLPRRLLVDSEANDDADNALRSRYFVALLKTALARQLRKRARLEQYSTVDDVVELIRRSKNILCLGGAGLSTSCGIPDFRSTDGIYARLAEQPKYADRLTDPTDMFDKQYFLHDPTLFYDFARSIYPSNFRPSPSHRFIRLLEQKNKLLRHYTQNIDTLEDLAGIERVLHCHGSFSKAQCTNPSCSYTVPGAAIKSDIFAQRVPQCPQCTAKLQAKRSANGKKATWRAADGDDDEDDDDGDSLPGWGVLKPCITFFGEKVTDEFDRLLLADREKVDLLLVIGTSLKVAPVSELVGHIPHTTPVVLINRTPILHYAMDIQLLGNADTIVEYLCNRLDWTLPEPQPLASVVGKDKVAQSGESLPETKPSEPPTDDTKGPRVQSEPQQLDGMHIWLFPGAEVDELLEILAEDDDDDQSEPDVHEDGRRKRTATDSPALSADIEESKEKRQKTDVVG